MQGWLFIDNKIIIVLYDHVGAIWTVCAVKHVGTYANLWILQILYNLLYTHGFFIQLGTYAVIENMVYESLNCDILMAICLTYMYIYTLNSICVVRLLVVCLKS